MAKNPPPTAMRLQPTLNAAAQAREAVRDVAAGMPAEMVDDAALLTSEVVTNAVQHAGGIVTLAVERSEEAIVVAVTDSSVEELRTGPAPIGLAAHGRGLQLVESLADAWGCNPTANKEGKVVWFRVGASACRTS